MQVVKKRHELTLSSRFEGEMIIRFQDDRVGNDESEDFGGAHAANHGPRYRSTANELVLDLNLLFKLKSNVQMLDNWSIS